MSQRYVDVEFSGEVKQLRFDFNSATELEEAFGMGIMAILQQHNIGFRALRIFYWAGLKWRDKGLTLQRTGMLLQEKIEDGETIITLFDPVMKALKLSKLIPMDDDEVVDDPNVKKARKA